MHPRKDLFNVVKRMLKRATCSLRFAHSVDISKSHVVHNKFEDLLGVSLTEWLRRSQADRLD